MRIGLHGNVTVPSIVLDKDLLRRRHRAYYGWIGIVIVAAAVAAIDTATDTTTVQTTAAWPEQLDKVIEEMAYVFPNGSMGHTFRGLPR